MIQLLALACTQPVVGVSSEVKTPLPDYETVDTGEPIRGDTASVDTEELETTPDPEAPRVLINEVVAQNDSTWSGSDGAWPDWIELYNASDQSIPLADLALRDTQDLPWLGGEGTLEPGARLVIAADDTPSGEGLHAPFSLDAGGSERIVLSVRGVVSDRLAIGELPRDVAWARVPDGGDWAPTVHTTPDAANPSSVGTSLDIKDGVFQTDEVLHFNIRLSDVAINSLRSNRLTYVKGALDVPEGDWGDVDVKLKSYVGSSRTIDQKCAFKIDLNDYSGRKWHGLGKLTLNNMVQDNTYVHEWAAYELFRAMGVPAPRVGYARVSVNDTDFGLYLMLESIDQDFLEEWYPDPSGNLYEGAYGVDLYDYYIASFDYKGGSGVSDRSDIQELVDILDDGATDANYERLKTVMDMDEFLANMAVEGLIMHWDGYSTANNYRLYKDPTTGLFQIIPWGTDQTFLSAYFSAWTGRGRMFQWCLSVGSCSERYDEILLEATYMMDALDLDTRVADLESNLRDDIETDPRREFDLPTHDYYLSYTESNMISYPQTVRDQLSAR